MPPLGENYREYHLDEKRAWSEGPWQHEPDKAQWIDAKTGLDCLIVRNHFGSLCGYVGVPPGHRWFGVPYDTPDVEVHGGITFADKCQHGDEAQSVCHVPAPGRPEVWWFGFDCGHAFDYQPGRAKLRIEHGLADLYLPDAYKEIYRDWAYVVGEVETLAEQLQ